MPFAILQIISFRLLVLACLTPVSEVPRPEGRGILAFFVTIPAVAEKEEEYITNSGLEKDIERLRREMNEAANRLEFEKAALIRDKIKSLQQRHLRI